MDSHNTAADSSMQQSQNDRTPDPKKGQTT